MYLSYKTCSIATYIKASNVCMCVLHTSLSHYLAIETEIIKYADNTTCCAMDRQLIIIIIMHACR